MISCLTGHSSEWLFFDLSRSCEFICNFTNFVSKGKAHYSTAVFLYGQTCFFQEIIIHHRLIVHIEAYGGDGAGI
jgi:hypothetical protein